MSVVLSEHLPLLATAPGGIQKLRGLILDLAMRGKLVAQEQSDEPAVNLLEKIEQERIRLETEGVYKKSKPLPPKPDCVPAYRLPNTWTWVRLGDVTNFGQTDKDGRLSNETWVLDLEDIQKDTSVLLNRVRFAERQATSDKNRFKTGDVLYGKLRPYLNKVIVADEDGACTTEILPVRGYYGIAPRYLMYALKRPEFISYVNSKSYGMKMPRLGTEDGRNALFPLAPLAAQHRIVTKVDELMALCERLEAEQSDAELAHARLVESLLDTLTQSTDAADLASNWQRIAEHFDTLFTTEDSIDRLRKASLRLAVMGRLVQQDPDDEPATKLLMQIADVHHGSSSKNGKAHKARHPLIFEDGPYALPDGWVWTNIESISNVGTGATPSRTSPAYFNPPEIPWVTSGETREPFINVTAERVSPLALKETNLTVYPVGTLIVAMYGQGKTRGQISELMIEAATNQACAAIVPAVSDMAMRKYTKLYFLKIYDEIREEAAGGAQPNLNIGKIKSTLISLPPLAEQHRIAAKVDELMTLCDRMKADLREARGQQSRLAETLIDVALEIA